MDVALLHRYRVLLRMVQEQAFSLDDLLEGRTAVNVEGDGGRDVFRARQLGLFTCNVKGVDIIATCEAEAAPLIHYLEQGGVYGSLEFSRLLGYDEVQIEQYAELLELQAKLGIAPWGYRKTATTKAVGQLGMPMHRQETNYSCGAAAVRIVLLYYGIDVPEAYLREALGSDPQEGTEPDVMVDYLNRAGLNAEMRQMTVAELHKCVEAGIPVILDLQAWSEEPETADYATDLVDGHYVVLSGHGGGQLYFADPANDEPVYLRGQDLAPRWHDVDSDGVAYHRLGITVQAPSRHLTASDNEATNEDLWEQAKSEAKKRFDKYPSAYANGWAVKWYNERGGKWRKKEARGKAKKDVGHGGLDEWFSGHGEGKSKAEGEATWGDWVAISPVTKELESGKKVAPGDIVGPCGISDDPDWKSVTKDGKDPLKCMPRQKAHDMDKSERAELAKAKMKAEREEGNTKKPVMTPTFEKSASRVASRWLQAAEGKYDHINFKPPESVANAAKKGLEYRQKASPSNRGGLTVSEASKQGIGSGVQRATNLKNRTDVSPEVIGKMVGFFSRHEKNKGIAPEHKSTPWNDKGHVAWLLWGGDPGKAWAEKVKGQMETADSKKSASRVASRHLEAAQFSEWLKWIVQPFAVLAKHHKEFVYGPIDDAMDLVIKDLAPKLVRALTEKEVESDVDKFLLGALDGRDGKPMADDDLDYRSGYVWGKANADDKDLARGQLPAYMKRQVIQSSVEDFKQRITERVIADTLKKVWHAVNPMTTFRAIKEAVKKHGWKLGVGFALFELFEHFVLPSLLAALFKDPRYLAAASLPIGEVVYAIVFRLLGRTPPEANKADEGGHLQWYEQEFGPVRLAALTVRPS